MILPLKCEPGTYRTFESDGAQCIKCDRGTYSNKSG
jgi:hypothetical protein